MARTEALKAAQKRYYEKHKHDSTINSYRSRAKNFILKYATKDELLWLRGLIDEKLKEK